MNKAYRLIWSSIKEAWVAVAEIVKSKGNLPSYVIGSAALMAAVMSGALPAVALDPGALPGGGQIVAGRGSISQSGNRMTVNQGSQQMIANWSSFNIGQNAGVQFNQPNRAAVALNRIQDQSPSQILGSLTANGQVWLTNPAGIIFGKSAQVDVGGLVASSLNITNENFLANKNVFEKAAATGAITNQGSIRTADGGYVAFIAPKVTNEGSITTSKGTTALAAGDKVTLDFTGDSLVTFTVDQGAIDALADNQGLIRADGGLVMMTAKAADSLTSAVVNNSGVIQARTMENKAGRIVLISDMEIGTTTVSGTLDASAPNGGDGGYIETSAARVNIDPVVHVSTRAAAGSTGQWLIDPYDVLIAPTGGNITGATIATVLNSTNVTIDTTNNSYGTGAGSSGNAYSSAVGSGSGDITVNDAITKTSSSATTLTLKAHNDININQPITSSSGRLNVVLTADQDNNGSGGINFGSNGSVMTKNGNFYVGSVSGTYDTVTASGQNFTMATGSYIDAGRGNLDISVKGNIQLPDNSGQTVKYALTSTYEDGSVNYYRYFNSGQSLYYGYAPYQYLNVSTTGGNITSANTAASVADILTSVDTRLRANNIGTSGNPIKISGPTDPYGLLTNPTNNSKTFANTAKTLYITNTVGDSYVDEIGVQNFSNVNVTVGNQANKTQDIRIMGDQGGTGHIVLNTDGSGVLALATGDVKTGGVPGVSGSYTSTPQGTDPSVFPTSVSISAPNITFANGSVDTGLPVSYYYQGVGTNNKSWGMSSYWASFSAYGSSSLTSSQVDGTADIKSVQASLTSVNIGTSANPIELSSNSYLTLDNTGGSTFLKVVDSTVGVITLTNRKIAGEHHLLWSGGDHIDYTTDTGGTHFPTISGGASDGSDFTATHGVDVSRGNRSLTMNEYSGSLELDTNSVNLGGGTFTANILNGNVDRNSGKAIFATNAKDGNAEITAGNVAFNIYDSTSGSIADLEIAKGGTAAGNTLVVNTYQGNVDLRELSTNHFKTLNITLNGASTAQNVSIDLAGPDDVNFSDSGSLVTIDGAKVNLSSFIRNWNLQVPSRTIQVGGTSLGSSNYTLYGGNGLKLNGDVLTNGGNINLNGGGTGIVLSKSVRIDSNADDPNNSTSTGTSGSIQLSGTLSASATGYSLVVDSGSSDNSGNMIQMSSGAGNGGGAYLSGLTLTSKGSSNTNDGAIYLYGQNYYLNGNFASTGNTNATYPTLIDTEQGNVADGGNITFSGYNLSGSNYYVLTFDTSTTASGHNGGNIDLYGTYSHGILNAANITVNAAGGSGGTAGNISLPAVATNYYYSGGDHRQSYTGGIITLNGNLTTEYGNVTLNGDVRLASNVTIDTWQSANSQQNVTAGSVTITGTGVSAIGAGKTLTIDTSTDTGTGYFNPPTNTLSWNHNGGAVSIKAGNSGGYYVDMLNVNTARSGTYNNGSSGAITLNGVATTNNQTYTGGAATIAGDLATNGGSINLSGVSGITLGGGNPIAIRTDMAGGTNGAGTLNLGSLAINGAKSLTIDTTADGGGAGTDLTLNAVGNTTPLTSLNAKAKSLTVGGAIHASGDVTLQASGTSSDLTLNQTVTSGGNIVLADGRNFINNSGAGALVPGTGRSWQVWSSDPANDTRGGLAYDFKQYDATYGSTVVLGSGNGFLYTLAPTITPSLTGSVVKTYDGSAAAALTGDNYSVSGAVDGDAVVLNNPASGSYYSPDAGENKTVTASGLSLSATNGSATVYGYQLSSTSASAAIGTINKAHLTVTADNQSRLYGQANPTFTETITGFVNGENATSAGITGNATGSTAATATTGVGTATINGSTGNLNAVNYDFAPANGTLTINPRPITLTATDQSKTYGTSLDLGSTAFTLTSGTLANNENINEAIPKPKGFGIISIAISPQSITGATLASANGYAASATQGAGTYAGEITIGDATGSNGFNASNYSITYAPGTLTINKAHLTVTADNQSRLYGQNNPTLTQAITGFVNGENATSAGITGTATGSSTAGTTTGVGNHTITASTGDLNAANYDFTAADGTLTINKAHLTVTADNQSRLYGQANPTFTETITGFVNGENTTTAGINGSATGSTTATGTTGVGNNTITASTGDLNAANYDFTAADGTLTINKAHLTVTADNQSRLYGQANPTFTETITGFVNGENATSAGITGSATGSTAATATTGVGTATITGSTGTLNAANYDFAPADGTLTINKAHLTVTADNQSRLYGQNNLTFSETITGFVNGENAISAGITGTATGSTAATATTGVGTATITGSTGTLNAANYDFAPADGTLTINKAHLTVTADNQNRLYGQANPGFSETITGFVNGENATSAGITGTATGSTAATATTGVGNYTITGSIGNLSAANYDFTSTDGTLSITSASLNSINSSNSSLTSIQKSDNGTQQNAYTSGTPAMGPGAGSTSLTSIANTPLVNQTGQGSTDSVSPVSAPVSAPSGASAGFNISSTSGSVSVNFTQNASGVTTLTSGTGHAGENMAEVGSLPLFKQQNNGEPALQAVYSLKEGAESVAVKPETGGTTSQPSANASAGKNQPFELYMPNGNSVKLTVAVASDGFLTVTVPPGKEGVDTTQAMLMGMSVAKRDLNTNLKDLKGVVIKTQ